MNKIGACAALTQAGCYLFGFALLVTIMNPGSAEEWTSVQKLEFILDRTMLFQIWNIVIYVVFGIALVALTAVLHRLLDRPDSIWMSIASPFGFIWAGLVIASGMIASVGLSAATEQYASNPEQAAKLWSTLGVIQNGLGGGVEVAGGVWVLLISLGSMRRGGGFPVWLNGLGLIVALAGILTVVPALTGLGAVFGLTQIVWFLAVAAVLFRWRDQALTTHS